MPEMRNSAQLASSWNAGKKDRQKELLTRSNTLFVVERGHAWLDSLGKTPVIIVTTFVFSKIISYSTYNTIRRNFMKFCSHHCCQECVPFVAFVWLAQLSQTAAEYSCWFSQSIPHKQMRKSSSSALLLLRWSVVSHVLRLASPVQWDQFCLQDELQQGQQEHEEGSDELRESISAPHR